MHVLTKREKQLRFGKPWKTILYFCLPTVLIMVIQGFYNIVDKTLALEFAAPDLAKTNFYMDIYNTSNHIAPGTAIPLEQMKIYINIATQYATQTYNLLLAFGVMAGMGAAMRFSVAYGQKDDKRMKEITGNAFTFTILFSAVCSFLVFCLIFPRWHSILITSQMGDHYNKITNYLAWEYSYPMLIAAPIMFLSFYFICLLRSEGRMNWVIIIMVSAVIINCVAAIFFMKVCHLKMEGAMLGTISSWTVQVIWGFIIVFKFKNSYSKFGLNDMFHLKKTNIYSFLKTGLPNFITNVSFVITSYLATALVVTLPAQPGDSNNVSILQELISSINPWITLIFSAGVGISQGSRAIIAYNFGAQKNKRIWEILKRSSILFFLWFTFIIIVLCIFANPMMELFAFPKQYANEYRWWLVLSFSAYPLASLTLISFTLYQGINKSLLGAFTTSLRAFTIAIPMTVLGYFVAIWTGQAIYYFIFMGLIDLASSFIIVPILYNTWKKNKNNLVDKPEEQENKSVLLEEQKIQNNA